MDILSRIDENTIQMCSECGCKLIDKIDPDGFVALALELPGAVLVAVGMPGTEKKQAPVVLKEEDWIQRRDLPINPQ